MYTPVETVRTIDGRRLHRFQIVLERRGDADEEWVIVGFTDEGVLLADRDFEWTKAVTDDAFVDGEFEAVDVGGVPVWGY